MNENADPWSGFQAAPAPASGGDQWSGFRTAPAQESWWQGRLRGARERLEQAQQRRPQPTGDVGQDMAAGFRAGAGSVRGAPAASLAQGVVGGAAGLAGGAMELAPGAAGRAGAAISRFGAEQARQARERDYIPGLAGELAPYAIPLGRALQAPTMLGRVGRGAGVGAVFGAATPTGQEEGEARIGPKVAGAAIGAGLGAAVPAVGAGLRGVAERVLGRVQPETAQLAQRAEGLGFRLEPGQVRAERPMASPGVGAAAEHNQRLANRYVTRAMGQEAERITPSYINSRVRDLGRQYDDIYIGPPGSPPRQFRIDRQTVSELADIAQRERSLPAGSVTAPRNIASEIVGNFMQQQRQLGPGASLSSMNINGEQLQRLRTELARVYRSTTDNVDAGVALDTIRVLDDAIARNHPQIAERLRAINPQYRAVMTVERLAPFRGNVSLEDLGRLLESSDRNFVRGSSTNPLYELGRIGLDLGVRGIHQPASRVGPATEIPLGRLEQALGYGLRTQTARGIQRQAGQPPATPRTPLGLVPGFMGGAPTERQQ